MRAAASSHPFTTAEQAWFWFIQAARAAHDGTHYAKVGGTGFSNGVTASYIADILDIVDRLRRNRRLLYDHILVLRHYGIRAVSPIQSRKQEARAATLWHQAMKILDVAFVRQGLVIPHHLRKMDGVA